MFYADSEQMNRRIVMIFFVVDEVNRRTVEVSREEKSRLRAGGQQYRRPHIQVPDIHAVRSLYQPLI